jgi:hypothetical protein
MTEPIQPPNRGITPEAALALEAQGVPVPLDAIDSGDDNDEGISPLYEFPAMGDGISGGPDTPGFPASDPISSGDDIADVPIAGDESDGAGSATSRNAPAPSRSRITRSRSKKEKEDTGPRDATTRPPSLDEWEKFFSKIVLRMACDWYLAYAFRGIDEDMLTEREVERLTLSDDERKTIAVPFAELSNKSKLLRKHGRTIVSSGDAFNAMVVMGAWISRVNRIAAKYRPKQAPRVRVNGVEHNGSSGQGTQDANSSPFPTGAHGGHFPPGWSGGVVRGSG